jgi:hypothetical protein
MRKEGTIMAKITLIRWVNGVAVQASICELDEAKRLRKDWRKLPGELVFKTYRPEDDQIVHFAQQHSRPITPQLF